MLAGRFPTVLLLHVTIGLGFGPWPGNLSGWPVRLIGPLRSAALSVVQGCVDMGARAPQANIEMAGDSEDGTEK